MFNVVNLYRSIRNQIVLRQFTTEQLIAAYDFLNQSDPVKAKVNIQHFNQSKRSIMRELVRRNDVEFEVYQREDGKVS